MKILKNLIPATLFALMTWGAQTVSASEANELDLLMELLDQNDESKTYVCLCTCRFGGLDGVSRLGYYEMIDGNCSNNDGQPCLINVGNPPFPRQGTLMFCTKAPRPVPIDGLEVFRD